MAAAARIPSAYITASTSNLSLTLLSWNIAEALPSACAPEYRDCKRLIREECLRPRNFLPKTDQRQPIPKGSKMVQQQQSSGGYNSKNGFIPDIIALQECPDPFWGSREFGGNGYVSMGTKSSHCGYVDLLLREDLAKSSQPIQQSRSGGFSPSVAAAITLPNQTRIAVSSSHLAPFKEGAKQRAAQCESLMKTLANECDNCILLGDFNMRAAEEKIIENLCGGGWFDAWKHCDGSVQTKFTWDSFENKYHGDGAFQFKARFDRCYARGKQLNVKQYDLMGNEALGKGDFLSDHYGMIISLDVEQSHLQTEKEQTSVSSSLKVRLDDERNKRGEEKRSLKEGRKKLAIREAINLTQEADSADNETDTLSQLGSEIPWYASLKHIKRRKRKRKRITFCSV